MVAGDKVVSPTTALAADAASHLTLAAHVPGRKRHQYFSLRLQTSARVPQLCRKVAEINFMELLYSHLLHRLQRRRHPAELISPDI